MKIKNTLLLTLFTVFNLTGQKTPETPVNIILMIGDGMGLSQITAGMYINGNKTALEKFEYIGLSKTHSSKDLVTDSAASGTAMACGKKTMNGVLGLDINNNKLSSILEICKSRGYLTGLISTSSIVHATPASFYANVRSRTQYEDIALQLSENNIDYFIGGGEKHFKKRNDNRNLISEMKDYEMVNNLTKFSQSTSNKLGFFTHYEEPPRNDDGRKPTLDEALLATLDKFDQREKPFFIMVEGSQIDWGGHANDIDYITSEFKDFDGAISVAVDYVNANPNTLLIVTADHETGGLAIIHGKTKSYTFKSEFNTGGHSATMVPVFSYGISAEKFSGIYENTAIFDKMLETVEQN
jgi:alkaline phosphatase